MNIEQVAISSLVLDPANARRHPDKNLEAVKGSLARFGQQKPIVVGKNNVVIAGNGTLEAARALGWDKIDIVRTQLDGTEATAYAIADNRTGELAEWDAGVLSETLKSLQDLDFDLGSIGFDDDDLAKMIATPVTEGLTDPDEVPEDVETRCKPGDLWILGNHRLLCGDSTNVQHVERLMGGEKADMVFTDPPYGMNLDTDYKGSRQKGAEASAGNLSGAPRKHKSYRPVIGDDVDFDPGMIFGLFDYCKEVFLWGGDYYCQHLPKGGGWIVWDKTGGNDSLMDAGYGSNFELCWSKTPHKRDIARVTYKGVAGMKPEDGSRVHPTQKSVTLCVWFLDRWSQPKQVVADIFLGSGSTLIACEKTNRRCYGMEIDPKYCDVVIARWEQFTGNKAELASS